MRGAFYGWFIIMLQLGLVLSVSAHAVLGENDDGAKQSMLMLCCGLQLATAAWHVVGDANDRLAALVACAGSLMECASTGMLLAISYVEEAQKDDEHEAMLHGMAAACASLLTWAVFLPIVQELLYDVLLLQTTRTIIERRKRGEPWVKAVIGVLVAAITLPIAFLLSFFGLSFKGSDVVMEAAEREATRIGERMQASEASFTSPPEGLHDHGFDEATETKATCTPRAGLGWGKAQAHKVVHGALDRVGLEEPEQLPPPRVV